MSKITYKKAGVDIESMDAFKRQIKPLVRSSFRPEVLKDIGGFGSFFRLQKNNYKDPILVSSADGVGTKLKIAAVAKKHDTIGIDAVAMNVNDILCVGAEPLFFLDYVAFSKLSMQILHDIVRGVNEGCVQSGCALIGGETAQMPGMYKPGEYDIAGFCVGVVERERAIDGARIAPGDIIIGLSSSGIHSNGYSLVRKVLSNAECTRMADELLIPTRIYVKPVLALLHIFNAGRVPQITGIAHITGGAFYDKIRRILPETVDARINKASWQVPAIFKLIQRKGAIADREIYHTLNMGIGMVLMVRPQVADGVLAGLERLKVKAWKIGEITKGTQEVTIV
ncbi:MAG TPA: phosphoribosylformylglycinamidine cyclo-ligase [Candidatus Omnitrophota bacterium]|nr:phosphoribosylformylglycinamidine cyclo-ligase [Candidatus Omnitrophota bacterium]HPT07408.1 phosphoribosylformylglycinamidine cyclo-ligase [Candidatus Omnitrophota bacterium]